MTESKSALSFVGKSVAFALIAGFIWCVMILVVSSIGARGQSSSSGSGKNATLAEQIETYNKQLDAAHAQLVRGDEIQSRSEKLLDTQERLYAEQEKLQKRLSAVLDKWEKLPAK